MQRLTTAPRPSVWDDLDRELISAPVAPRSSVWDELDAELLETSPPPPTPRPRAADVLPPMRPVPSHEPTAQNPPVDEAAFRAWYADVAQRTGLSADPDAPEHFYDYRAAFAAGVGGPDETGHWPPQFKRAGHPNLIVRGVDTRTGQPVPAAGPPAGPTGPSIHDLRDAKSATARPPAEAALSGVDLRLAPSHQVHGAAATQPRPPAAATAPTAALTRATGIDAPPQPSHLQRAIDIATKTSPVGPGLAAISKIPPALRGAFTALPTAIGEQLFEQPLPGHANEPDSLTGRLFNHLRMVWQGRGSEVQPIGPVRAATNPPDTNQPPAAGDMFAQLEAGVDPQTAMAGRPRGDAERLTLETARRGLDMLGNLLTDPTAVATFGVKGTAADLLAAAFSLNGVKVAAEVASNPQSTPEDVAEAVLGAAIQTAPAAVRLGAPKIREFVRGVAEDARTGQAVRQADAAIEQQGPEFAKPVGSGTTSATRAPQPTPAQGAPRTPQGAAAAPPSQTTGDAPIATAQPPGTRYGAIPVVRRRDGYERAPERSPAAPMPGGPPSQPVEASAAAPENVWQALEQELNVPPVAPAEPQSALDRLRGAAATVSDYLEGRDDDPIRNPTPEITAKLDRLDRAVAAEREAVFADPEIPESQKRKVLDNLNTVRASETPDQTIARIERDLRIDASAAVALPAPAHAPAPRPGDAAPPQNVWQALDDELRVEAVVDTDAQTGEAQPRLPGAETARQAGIADTTFKAPQQATGSDFALGAAETPEAAARRLEQEQPSLAQEPDAPRGSDEPPGVTVADIPSDLAVRAYSGTSWTPERRAETEQREYVTYMGKVWSDLVGRVRDPERKALAEAEFARYRAGYLERYKGLLSRRTGLVSSMIAGPSKFPARQQEKKHLHYERALNDFLAWEKRARAAMVNAVDPKAPRAISADRADAVEALRAKVDEATRLQERMRQANVIIRRKDLSDEEKLSQIVALGLKERTAREALKPDFSGRIGFPDYLLKNNSADIRRLQARIAEITANRGREEARATFDGGRVEENAALNRVQVFFDQKPDQAMRAQLKASGFKWAPTEGAWQRQRNDAARAAVERLFGVTLSPKAVAADQEDAAVDALTPPVAALDEPQPREQPPSDAPAQPAGRVPVTARQPKGDEATFIGPRKIGGRYFDAYWGKEYTVVSIQRDDSGRPTSITVRDHEGTRSQATAWDKRDRIVKQPEESQATTRPTAQSDSIPVTPRGQAPAASSSALTVHERRELRRMLAEMESLPFTKHTFNRDTIGRGGAPEIVGGAGGAPVFQDVQQGRGGTRQQVENAIRRVLEGKKPSAIGLRAIEVARGRIAGDPYLSKPSLPLDAGDSGVPPGAGAEDVRAKAMGRVQDPSDLAFLVRRYAERSDFGNVVSRDNAKDLLHGGSKEARTRYNDAVSDAAGVLADAVFAERLKLEPLSPDAYVVLTAGGTGSGKTTVGTGSDTARAADVTFDSQATDLEAARQRIAQVLASGRRVHRVHVYRDPIDAWIQGVMPRAEEHGRPVSIEGHLASHRDALDTAIALTEAYSGNPDVTLTVIDNTGEQPKPVSPDEALAFLRSAFDRYNVEEIRHVLQDATDTAHASGLIDDALYAALTGRDQPASGRGGRGGPEGSGGGRPDEPAAPAVSETSREGAPERRQPPEVDRPKAETASRQSDSTSAKPSIPVTPRTRWDERGEIVLRHDRPPISAADVRSPNPTIEERFEAPSTARTLATRTRQVLQGIKDAFGRGFSFEYDLTRAGLDDAVERIDAFNRERVDAPRKIMDELAAVLDGLRRPEEYHAFQRIVMLRRDLELANAMQDGRIPKRELESGLTPLEAKAELDRLEAVAAREPEILDAAKRHRALVRKIGDELVDRGLMRAETRDRNADYFPALVLEHISTDANLVGRPLSPLTPGPRGFLKQARGGRRETIRDYIDALSRHLADVRKATMRDDLVRDLANRYDQSTQMAEGGEVPRGHSVWSYAGQAYLIPDTLHHRLVKFTQRTPAEVRAMNQATSWWKGATLRVLGLPYETLNFAGDVVNFLVSEPVRDLPKSPRRLFDAARATRAKSRVPVTSYPYLDDLRSIAELAERLNLGTGGATAELGRAVAQRPELRELRRPLGESVLKRLARIPGDAYRRATAWQDRFREFRENIPRLAKFMAEIERGASPYEAAKVTRRELVDYTRLTDFERIWMRGLLMPFFTWFKKNAENWLPGLRRGPDGSRAKGGAEAAGRIGKVMLVAYLAALYNESFFPEAEESLSDFDRHRFHLLIPTKDGVLYLGITGPANAAAGLVGLQGFTQRSLDLARGRTTLREEAERSGRQVRRNVLGLVSPITEPLEQLMNTDLRSGWPIVSDWDDLTRGERAKRRLQHAVDRFAPVSQITRSADEATGAPESAEALIKRLLFGSLAKRVDVDRNRTIATDRAVSRGQRLSDEESANERRADVRHYAAEFLRMGVEAADARIDEEWDQVDRSERALIVAALKEAARNDRRFTEILARWRAENRSISERQEPYVQEELQRKDLVPVTPR